jgi:hypothetical protein
MTDLIKARIVELVPDITKCPACDGKGWTAEHGNHHNPETGECEDCPVQVQCEMCRATGVINRPITLADILRAVEKVQSPRMLLVDPRGHFWYIENIMDPVIEAHPSSWNLTADYNGQTNEVKTFIGTLIGVV